jgi:hypothetical protein
MSKTASALLLVLACAASVSAQESLRPTHISNTGEVTVTAALRYQAGGGTLTSPVFDVDFDDTHLFGEFRAGVGIGGGLEIEGSIPFEFSGKGEADDGGVEFEVETAGLGDLTLEANYLIVPASKTTPQVMAGLVLVLPVGNDDFATPELRIGGVLVQDGDEGGIGEGVFKIGAQFGVDTQVTGAHLYGLARFVISTGTQDDGDDEIDHPDVFTLVAGAMVPLGGTSNLDIRLSFQYAGDEVADNAVSGEATEEAHVSFFLEPRFYFTVGSMATIFLGGNAGWVEDHAVNEETEVDLEDVFVYGITLGLHLRLGVPLVSK